jgi:hypothetical protein
MTLDASGNLGVGTTSPDLWSDGNVKQTTITGALIGVSNLQGNRTTTSDVSRLAFWQTTNRIAYIAGERAGADNSGALRFITSNAGSEAERARITSGGYFKASNSGTYISSTAPYHELVQNADARIAYCRNTSATLTGDNGFRIEFSGAAPNNTTVNFLVCADSAAFRTYIYSNGGLANYQANDVNLSDRREKTNFAPAKSYLNTICAIPVQTFNYIDQSEDDPGLTLGVVAQDVQAIAPELVSEDNWGTEENPKMRLSIYQTDLQYALMKCIQEQQALITSLTARVAALEGTQP